MRLKKIPKGTRVIRFKNPTEKDCLVHWNKKPLLSVDARSFKIIECATFIIGLKLKEFPEMNLYSNIKIKVAYM